MLQGIADAFARVKSRKNYLPPVLPLHMGGDDKDNLDQAEGVVADVWLEGETLWGRLDRLQESFLNAITGSGGDSHTPYLSVRIVPPGHPYNADQGEDWFLSHVARVPYPGDPNIGSPVDFLGSVPPDNPPDNPLDEPDMTNPKEPKDTKPEGQQQELNQEPNPDPELSARLQALEERLNQLTDLATKPEPEPEPQPEPEPEPVALAGKLSGHFQDVGDTIISAYRSRLAGLVQTGALPKASIPSHLGALSSIYLGQRALREIGYNFSGITGGDSGGVKEQDPIEAYFQALEGQEGIKPGSPDVSGDRPSDLGGTTEPEPDPLVLSQQQANERLRQAHLTVLGKN